MINFRYYIIKKLGEGGNGEVYLVDDRLKNCQRAMKVLSSSRHLDEDMIRKEFSVLSGLFHPHLIRVFDFGVVRQSDEQQFLHRHFYTMEYLEGTNALEYVRCVPLGKEKVELLEDLFIQTLGVIAYIHRKGIIHFDIKPQNLFLVEGHGHHKKTVKLTDFGFSETTVPSVDTAVRGTLEYIAPEIVQGFPIDHRIDLYSLGATFYHLWEGRCPFEASAPVELLRMVVSENLPPLAGVEGVRSLLPQLIERLCRKDPSERFEDARQILSNFASSKYEDSVKETLYFGQRLPFVGRRKEKGVIQEALQALEGGREPTVTSILVIGAQGSGKTELLNEVATEARSRSLLTLKSDRTSANRPFTSIERALRRLDMELCSRDLPSPFRETDDDTIFSPSPSSTGENELADRARRYASHMLRASTQLPILFILDDLPIMDPYSLETVRSIAADDKGGRIVLVASIRDDDADNCPFGDQTTTRIILKELSVDETLALIDSSLGRAFASTNIVQRIHSLYGGIPYIIMEAVTSIANALPLAVLNDPIGLTERGDDLVEFLSLSFEEFFATRFRGLRREKQIILELISCFEIPSPVEILKRVVPFQSDRLIDYLVSLEHQGYVVSHEEQRRFQFRHLKLKEYVYHSIEYDRAALHNFIATTLETLTADIGWSDRNELGRQFRLGNTNAKALEHFEAAGDQARVEGALADADAMYKNALGCLSEDEREVRVSLSLKLAEVYQAKGSDQESITIYEQLLAELSAEDPRCKTINKSLGKGFARLGENAKALHNFQAALHGLVENVDRLEIQQEIISLKIAEGSFDEAIHMGEVQKTLAGSQGDRNFLALVETDLGIAQFYKGSFRESLEAFQRALTIYDNAGNKSKTIDALNNIGNVLSAMKDFRAALEKWKQALILVGDRDIHQQRAMILNNLGIAHYKLREFSEAWSHYQSAREIFHQLNSKSGVAMALTNLGEVTYAECKYEEALHYWTDALSMYEEMQDSNGIGQTLLETGQLHITVGDLSLAEQVLDQVDTVREKFNLKTFEALSQYLHGLVHMIRGDYSEALTALKSAEKAFQVEGSFTGGCETEFEKQQIILLRMAEICCRWNEYEKAISILEGISNVKNGTISPLIIAEVNFHLGEIARCHPDLLPARAVMYFKEGLSLIEGEQVSEISWKLSNALGREFDHRGNREKAHEYIMNAKRILEYFSSLFTSEALRERYLASYRRHEVLELIESRL